MYERWVEEDGGNSTLTINYSVNNINFTYTIKSEDDELGLATVSYYDIPVVYVVPVSGWTTYNITNFNFRRTIFKP